MSIQNLVKRYSGNPILTAEDLPGADGVFNCGAIKFKDKYLLLVSVSKPGTPGCGRAIHVAESADGLKFKIRPEPFIAPGQDGPFTEFDYDLCDPRVVFLDNTYYITYPAHKPGVGIVGVLGKTDDFVKYTRLEYASLPNNRVPVLFPEKVNGQYVRLDRPYGYYGGSMWVSFSNDLYYWGKHRLLLHPGEQVWNSAKVGPSGPPIKTDKGWLVIYHAVSGGNIAAMAYHQAVMLLDLEDPSKVIACPNEYIMGPKETYERIGRVPNVVFSTGHIVEPDGEVKLYYAASDTCICLATFNLNAMVDACLKFAV